MNPLQAVAGRIKALEQAFSTYKKATTSALKRQDETALREIQSRDEEIRQLNRRIESLERSREAQSHAVADLVVKMAELRGSVGTRVG